MNTPPSFPNEEACRKLRDHIHTTWETLTRDLSHPLSATDDSKVDQADDDTKRLIYVSAREDLEKLTDTIRRRVGEKKFSKLELRVLPPEADQIQEHGLLYLPGPYVVPGGRFNEFYGWDSYFIQRGLLRDGRHDLAFSMVNQALYEVEHYGMVLNANRTYYLSRSHPPVLSLMIHEQYKATADRQWLLSTIPILEKYYYYWRVTPHLNQATGLSRYFDMGHGPAPEVSFSEIDEEGLSHYDRMKEHLKTIHAGWEDVGLYYNAEENRLTDLAYTGDRSMRESGFDPTDRFGPLNLDVIHYAPVCLNVLLHRMEHDLANFHEEAGDSSTASHWKKRGQESAGLIQEHFWNEEHGLYFDLNLRRNEQRIYPFLTTFWPMWVGIADKRQAERMVADLGLFQQPGGLETSTRVTGAQWDAPFAWAPLQLIAVEALEQYGYHEEARDIARRFVSMVAQSFEEENMLLEKYDARRCSGSVEGRLKFGYTTNEPGFGWTNAVVLEFLHRYGD